MYNVKSGTFLYITLIIPTQFQIIRELQEEVMKLKAIIKAEGLEAKIESYGKNISSLWRCCDDTVNLWTQGMFCDKIYK